MALPSNPSPDPIRAWLAAVIRGAEPGAMPDEAVLLDTAGAEGVLALCHRPVAPVSRLGARIQKRCGRR